MNRERARGRRRQSGFTLIEIAVVAVIVALITGGLIQTLTVLRLKTGISESRSRQDAVVSALQNFLARNGRLPCPAVANLPQANVRYGLEALTPGSCDGTFDLPSPLLPAAPPVVPGGGPSANGVVRGVLPWRTLQLGSDARLDGWSNQFTYVVVASATAPNSLAATNWSQPLNIRLFPTGATAAAWVPPPPPDPNELVVGGGVAAVISHGPNGIGGYTVDGALNPVPNPLPAGYVDEPLNWDNGVNLVDANFNQGTVNPFDDVVRVLTEDQVVQPLAAQGVIRSKRQRAVEQLTRIENALMATVVRDIVDPDGPPQPAGCNCALAAPPGTPFCGANPTDYSCFACNAAPNNGCARTVRRALPHANCGADGNGIDQTDEEELDCFNGAVPWASLALPVADAVDPWGRPIVYVVDPNAADDTNTQPPVLPNPPANQSRLVGVFSNPAPVPAFSFQLVSFGPDGVPGACFPAGDDVCVTRAHTDLVGRLATAASRVD